MALFAASGELSSLTHNGNVAEGTTTNRFDPTYGIRCGTRIVGDTATQWLGTGPGIGGPFSNEFWHRGTFFLTQIDNGRTLFEYLNAEGVPVFRWRSTGTRVVQFQYWSGSAWTNVGAPTPTLTYSENTGPCRFDLRIVCGSSFSFYFTTNRDVEPALLVSGSADMPLVTAINEIKTYPWRSSGNEQPSHSEWIWGDEPTIGHRYAYVAPTGDGVDTSGSGSYLDVDEVVTNDVDLSSLANAGDAETYTHTTMSVPNGRVRAVQIESRVRRANDGPQNVKARLRIGIAAYDHSDNAPSLGITFGPYRANWQSNPAGGGWTPNAAVQVTNQFGLAAQP